MRSSRQHMEPLRISRKESRKPLFLIIIIRDDAGIYGWSDAANLITSAMEQAFSAGEATHDLARFMPNGKSLGTKEFGDRIISIIETIKLV